MNIVEQDFYRKGFLEGLDVNNKYPLTISIAGYKFEEILKILMEDKARQKARRST